METSIFFMIKKDFPYRI